MDLTYTQRPTALLGDPSEELLCSHDTVLFSTSRCLLLPKYNTQLRISSMHQARFTVFGMTVIKSRRSNWALLNGRERVDDCSCPGHCGEGDGRSEDGGTGENLDIWGREGVGDVLRFGDRYPSQWN